MGIKISERELLGILKTRESVTVTVASVRIAFTYNHLLCQCVLEIKEVQGCDDGKEMRIVVFMFVCRIHSGKE